MKNFILSIVLVLLFSTYSFGQQTKVQHNNFKLNERVITWQKIYESDKTVEEIITYFKKQALTEDIEFSNGSLIGTSALMKASPIKSFYWAFSDFTMFITFDFKDDKYRVTLKDFKYVPAETSMDFGGVGISTPVSTTLSQSYVRNNHNELRSNKTARKYLTTLDNDLIKAFEIKENPKNNDNW